MMSDAHLAEAAKLLRRYHDVAAEFRPPPNAKWRLAAPTAYEVICHNDWSPWNALLRDGRVAVVLDWDLAGPGTRLWDIAMAAASWAPLFSSMPSPSVAERARRLRSFVDAYGLADRSELLLTMRLRLRYVGDFVAREAASGDPGMQRLVGQNVPKTMWEDDVVYLDRNWAALERAL
jgi:Ser/Thr protein kinase RdoA (MazF antagonist)